MYHILNNQKEDRAEGRGERAERERERTVLFGSSLITETYILV